MSANPANKPEPVRSLADIEAIEAVPLAARNLPESTYALILAAARANPDKLAIRYIENGNAWRAASDKGETSLSIDITYAELIGNINRAANLFHSLGVAENDVVSMLLPNIPQAHYTLWGAEAAGCVNPINFMLEAEVIGEIVESAGSRVLVVLGQNAEFAILNKLDVILEIASCVEHVLLVGAVPTEHRDWLNFDDCLLLHNAESLDFARQFGVSTVASLFHTGGTTGVPKLAQHTHGNEVYTAWAVNSLWPGEGDDCYLTGLPLFHCNAAIGTGLAVFMVGGTVLLAGINGYRSPGIVQNMFRMIDHYRVTNFSAVPTIYAVLAQIPLENCDLGSMRFALCGAAPMPVELFYSFERATGIRIVEGYGLTEATVCSTLTPPAASQPRIGSIGLRIPYTRIRLAVLDENGVYQHECAPQEIGTILIQAPSVTPGYTDASKNAELFVTDDGGQEWLNTGDLARQDADGYFWLTGRAKELIIRGGHNIDPKTIEEALAKHPAVNLAAAVGRPDSYAGEIPVAYVDTVAKTSTEELLTFCRQHIGERAAVPKDIVILDKLPVTAVGKIHKPTLHLLEIEWVVRKELEQFATRLSNCQVVAEADKKRGNTARITIAPRDTGDTKAIEHAIRKALDVYTFSYDITFQP